MAGNRRGNVRRECVRCSSEFWVKPCDVKPGRAIYCSMACKGRDNLDRLQFQRPEASRREVVNANGLINARIRSGTVDRPSECQACEKSCKPDAHHPDYTRPGWVLWLCRSCHMRLHLGTLPDHLRSKLEGAA